MRQYLLSIHFSYSELEAAYQRPDMRLLLRADGGQLLSVPFRYLRPYVGPSGIQGRFALELDEQNQIRRLYALP
ncbi:DUF2835 family protein [Gallaecimonas kandeliae]|uniref:DUF2835 family protein n=1 Tax=Gallaecimonas kandeliae TaxID=3029055 RepID=UPI00264A118A|nr:DUF2835 family protein [Gallaecimonas kandeliae]WKE67367.1 DUF2835 family protein [Gallaecimonas kandeliae]